MKSKFAVVTLVVMSLFALPAAAQAATIGSTVKISDYSYNVEKDKVTFVGKVKSNKAKCEKRRTVVLRQVSDGIKAGTARTNRKGEWEIKFAGDRVPPGKFRATVLKKRVSGDTCKADTSAKFNAS